MLPNLSIITYTFFQNMFERFYKKHGLNWSIYKRDSFAGIDTFPQRVIFAEVTDLHGKRNRLPTKI